jgi:hypothetical protein
VEPEACLYLQDRAAHYLWSQGQYRQAQALHRQTLAARRRLLGDEHPNTRWSMTKLASLRQELERLQP